MAFSVKNHTWIDQLSRSAGCAFMNQLTESWLSLLKTQQQKHELTNYPNLSAVLLWIRWLSSGFSVKNKTKNTHQFANYLNLSVKTKTNLPSPSLSDVLLWKTKLHLHPCIYIFKNICKLTLSCIMILEQWRRFETSCVNTEYRNFIVYE